MGGCWLCGVGRGCGEGRSGCGGCGGCGGVWSCRCLKIAQASTVGGGRRGSGLEREWIWGRGAET
jgi:hypothetical protein